MHSRTLSSHSRIMLVRVHISTCALCEVHPFTICALKMENDSLKQQMDAMRRELERLGQQLNLTSSMRVSAPQFISSFTNRENIDLKLFVFWPRVDGGPAADEVAPGASVDAYSGADGGAQRGAGAADACRPRRGR